MGIEEISDTGDQVLRKAAVDLLTGGKEGIDYALRIWSLAAGPLGSTTWDSWIIDSTGAVTDIVKYFDGGLGGTLVATFTAIYTNNCKNKVISGVWT